MKRDFDLIRAIILGLESESGFSEKNLQDRYNWSDVLEHLKLLNRKGCVDWDCVYEDGYPFGLQLTWRGHDLADAMRSEVAWSRVRGQIKNGINLQEVMKLLWENQ